MTQQTAGTAGAAISHDAAADTVTITLNGAEYAVLSAQSGQGNGTFDGYFGSNPDNDLVYGFRAVSDSGASEVIVAYEDEGNAVVVSEIARNIDTTLPTSGELSYRGGYLGLLTAGPDAYPGAITGVALLTVSFDDGETSGRITNRNAVFAGDLDPPFSDSQTDVVFSTGTLSADGSFAGASETATFRTTGSVAGTYSGSGTYSGLITGDEAVGSLAITYDHVSGEVRTYTETGVFILTEDTP